MTPLELFHTHQSWAEIVAHAYIKRKNLMGLAKDLTGIGLGGLWLACIASKTDDPTIFRGFAKNHVIGAIQDEIRASYFRGKGKHTPTPDKFTPIQYAEPPIQIHRGFAEIDSAEQLEHIFNTRLKPLRTRDKIVILMKMEGISAREIAEHFDMSEEGIRFILKRAQFMYLGIPFCPPQRGDSEKRRARSRAYQKKYRERNPKKPDKHRKIKGY